MKYIKRHAEATVNTLSEMFGAILVAGPRQVGKTTMLQRITEGMNYATLDDLIVRAAAQEQSGTFFKDNPPPVFVDEIQKAPELFSQIKMLIDREHKKGQFFMCGSQQFQMMKGVSESLSGRIGLVTLLGFSLRERYGVSNDTPFLPTDAYFDERKKQLANIPYEEVWKMIHRGSMPELCENPDFDWQMFYGAYVRTYIERDVRDLSEIGDTVKFTRFMTAACRSIHRAACQPCLYGAGCRNQSADSRTMAFDPCSLQYRLSVEAILKQHHQACGEDSKAVFLGYRAGGLPYPVEYAGCFEKRRYGRCFL